MGDKLKALFNWLITNRYNNIKYYSKIVFVATYF